MSNQREMVFDRATGQLRALSPHIILSSAALKWRGVLLEQHRLPCLPPSPVIWINNVVVVHLNAVQLESSHESGTIVRQIRPGQVTIIPAEAVSMSHCAGPLEFIMVSLEPKFMRAASYAFSNLQVPLARQYGIDDPLIKGLCLTLHREVEQNGAAGQQYSDCLTRSLAIHLAAKHSLSPRAGSEEIKGGLSPRAMQRAIEFVNARLSEDFSLREMAAEAGLSPFHFARLFKQALGLPPYQYVLNQRIEAAKRLMLGGGQSLTEIALEVGFYDQAHFARHFKRLNGLTPRAFIQQLRATE